MKQILSLLALVFLALPGTTLAYVTPEEVLLNEQLYLPPRTRETEDRINRQQADSEIRRAVEFDIGYTLQHPPTLAEEPSAPETLHGAAGEMDDLSAADLELVRTLRLLDRVEERQAQQALAQSLLGAQLVIPGAAGPATIRVGQSVFTGELLHAGAPLAPTGPGAILAAGSILGALGWTMRRAGKTKGMTKRSLYK